jgi:predicted nucleic acid-binding Zn ribbon protein
MGSEEPGSTTCPNCGKEIREEDVFCSLKCEQEWLRRESSKSGSEGILFCPRCGNAKLQMAIPGIISIWKCPTCGYRGSLAVRDGVMRERIREDYQGREHEGEG